MAFNRIAIPPAKDVEDLRRTVEIALNRLINQLHQNDHRFQSSVDAQDNRITNLAPAAKDGDAVSLGYLKIYMAKAKADLDNQLNRRFHPYVNPKKAP